VSLRRLDDEYSEDGLRGKRFTRQTPEPL
jgi:hypothetical protein